MTNENKNDEFLKNRRIGREEELFALRKNGGLNAALKRHKVDIASEKGAETMSPVERRSPATTSNGVAPKNKGRSAWI